MKSLALARRPDTHRKHKESGASSRRLLYEDLFSGTGFRRRGLKDGVVGGFGVALPIEEERVVSAAMDREKVQPRIAIGHAPECDAGHGVSVLEKDLEKVGVALR